VEIAPRIDPKCGEDRLPATSHKPEQTAALLYQIEVEID
jgi:hypothetical protein